MADRRPKVLVLNHFAAPRGQAGGTRHVELFSRLEGWDYLIVASDLNPQTGERVGSEAGFQVVHVPAYSSNGARRILNWIAYALRAFVVGMRQRDVSVVYGSSPHLLAAAAAWCVAAVKRRPFVMEVRDLWPQVLVDMGQLSASSPVFKVLRLLERFLYSRASAVVVMAQGSVDALVAMGVSRGRIHYIPNGADSADFAPSAPRDQLRAKYRFDQFTAVYAGAHGPANGLDLLLDAAATVSDLDLEIVLVGGGIEKDRLVWRAQTERLGNVRFMDPVPKTEIRDLLGAADVGLHVLADVELFRTAVSPNKVFDYMAAQLPILTNSPGMVGDLVTSSGSGIVVEAKGLAEGLRASYDERDPEAGRNGMCWLDQNQSRTAMGVRLKRVLEGVL